MLYFISFWLESMLPGVPLRGLQSLPCCVPHWELPWKNSCFVACGIPRGSLWSVAVLISCSAWKISTSKITTTAQSPLFFPLALLSFLFFLLFYFVYIPNVAFLPGLPSSSERVLHSHLIPLGYPFPGAFSDFVFIFDILMYWLLILNFLSVYIFPFVLKSIFSATICHCYFSVAPVSILTLTFAFSLFFSFNVVHVPCW